MATVTANNVLRRVWFAPYVSGPRFVLTTWDTGRTGFGGKYLVGYRLESVDNGARAVVFEGEDFGCSPMHAVDADETCRGVMSFLTLRPGDTDSEYFDSYTPEQLEFAGEHAEALGCAVSDRFGEE